MEDLLGSYNLLYIDQYTADADGNIAASYIMKEEYEDAIIFLVRMSEIQLTADNTEITADNLVCTGESQVVRPVVIYDGRELVPGTDYDVEGDLIAVSAGEYTAVIVGKGNYAGDVEFTYNVTGEEECLHEFVDGVCIICGETVLSTCMMRLKSQERFFRNLLSAFYCLNLIGAVSFSLKQLFHAVQRC